MKNISKGLPSVFTSLALISGCISIVITTMQGNLTLAGYFILISAVLDFVDGMVARLLHSISEFGKQLDSLADQVSFGVAPAMILYRLLLHAYAGDVNASGSLHLPPGQSVAAYSAFLVAAFSALRLAKFNLDLKQVKNFRGLPTPANALFLIALGFASESHFPFLQHLALNTCFLLITILLSCFLLVSNVPMFSLKFSSAGIRENSMRYLFVILAVVLLVIFQLPGLAGVILLYILMSLLNQWFIHMS
jgi:CDP-diacylglycerol---serine O-phosphatidyltransferase